jgi:hypothetical protein
VRALTVQPGSPARSVEQGAVRGQNLCMGRRSTANVKVRELARRLVTAAANDLTPAKGRAPSAHHLFVHLQAGARPGGEAGEAPVERATIARRVCPASQSSTLGR